MNSNVSYAKLSVCSFGIALGLTNGLGMMILAWMAMQWDIGAPLITLVASLYHGYDATVIGGLYGAGWGFLDGFIFGVIAGLFYNLSLCCCCSKKKSK